MTELGVVLEAIENLRSDYREDLKPLWKSVNENSEKVNKVVSDHRVLKNEVKHINKTNDLFSKHLGNNEVHFNKKKLQTTTLGYWAKKRTLIILLTSLGIIVSAITGVAVAWIQGWGG